MVIRTCFPPICGLSRRRSDPRVEGGTNELKRRSIARMVGGGAGGLESSNTRQRQMFAFVQRRFSTQFKVKWDRERVPITPEYSVATNSPTNLTRYFATLEIVVFACLCASFQPLLFFPPPPSPPLYYWIIDRPWLTTSCLVRNARRFSLSSFRRMRSRTARIIFPVCRKLCPDIYRVVTEELREFEKAITCSFSIFFYYCIFIFYYYYYTIYFIIIIM